jgi:hypothetical protein
MERDEGRESTGRRLYPDAGLKTPTSEYRSTLVETVKALFPKIR